MASQPIAIRFLESPPLHGVSESRYYDGTVDFSKLEAGDMCFYYHRGMPCTDAEHLARLHLTAHYRAHNAGRPPLILALPDSASRRPLYFLVDGQCYSQERGHYDGWTVSGSPPLITVHPSVDYPGHYHGFIQNGVVGPG